MQHLRKLTETHETQSGSQATWNIRSADSIAALSFSVQRQEPISCA